jgi:hypothetical protein
LNPRQPDPQSGALTRLSYDHQPSNRLISQGPRVKFAAELGRHPAANLEYANYLIGVKEPELAGPKATVILVDDDPDVVEQIRVAVQGAAKVKTLEGPEDLKQLGSNE